MLSPTSVTEKQPCIRAINDLLHGSASINNSEAMSELTKDTFLKILIIELYIKILIIILLMIVGFMKEMMKIKLLVINIFNLILMMRLNLRLEIIFIGILTIKNYLLGY